MSDFRAAIADHWSDGSIYLVHDEIIEPPLLPSISVQFMTSNCSFIINNPARSITQLHTKVLGHMESNIMNSGVWFIPAKSLSTVTITELRLDSEVYCYDLSHDIIMLSEVYSIKSKVLIEKAFGYFMVNNLVVNPFTVAERRADLHGVKLKAGIEDWTLVSVLEFAKVTNEVVMLIFTPALCSAQIE